MNYKIYKNRFLIPRSKNVLCLLESTTFLLVNSSINSHQRFALQSLDHSMDRWLRGKPVLSPYDDERKKSFKMQIEMEKQKPSRNYSTLILCTVNTHTLTVNTHTDTVNTYRVTMCSKHHHCKYLHHHCMHLHNHCIYLHHHCVYLHRPLKQPQCKTTSCKYLHHYCFTNTITVTTYTINIRHHNVKQPHCKTTEL